MGNLELLRNGFSTILVAFKFSRFEHAVFYAAASGCIAIVLGFAVFTLLIASTISEALIKRAFRLCKRLVHRKPKNSGSGAQDLETSRSSLRVPW